jgi:hypothetical protein
MPYAPLSTDFHGPRVLLSLNRFIHSRTGAGKHSSSFPFSASFSLPTPRFFLLPSFTTSLPLSRATLSLHSLTHFVLQPTAAGKTLSFPSLYHARSSFTTFPLPSETEALPLLPFLHLFTHSLSSLQPTVTGTISSSLFSFSSFLILYHTSSFFPSSHHSSLSKHSSPPSRFVFHTLPSPSSHSP